jgi:glutamine synthetase
MNIKLEYVWLDGYQPEPNLRSKIKVINTDKLIFDIQEIPEWNFDGSSTQQAEGSKSDCILKPVRIYHAKLSDRVYVFCEVMNPDGTPHETNFRSKLEHEDENIWFGFEQEYFIQRGFGEGILGHDRRFVEPQGKYYCGVGSNVVGRDLVEKHLNMCLQHGITITGVNAEVALGQWEFQVFTKGKFKAGDDLWMSRYFLYKISEEYGYEITLHPKPLQHGEWNGSGLHTNFSTEKMRNIGGEKYFQALFSALESRKEQHIKNYGSDNHMRLTGKFETQSIDKFSVGVSDRGASIRIPAQTVSNDWKGYVEDRRPASNADPYRIIFELVETLKMTDELNEALNNMYSNVNMKKFDEIREKYNGILSSEELLNEYRDDNDFEVDSETMNGWNMPSEEIKFDVNGK